MKQPEPQSMNYSTLIHDIDKGIIKIPQFQRDFVWSLKESAKLIDSIIKGYPIGTFILWESNEELRSVRNIGGAELPETPPGTMVQYVLDGQQRMTSLYASLKGLKVERENRTDDFSEIYIDLLADEEDPIVITNIEDCDEQYIISLKDLLSGSIRVLAGYPEHIHGKLEEYKNRLHTYRFPAVLLRNASLNVATEVFTRLNVGGKSLTVFEIMVAKTFDTEKKFDLAEKYKQLRETLEQVNYETIPESTVLQSVSMLLKQECSRKTILNLDKQQFIHIWEDAVEAMIRAIEYFRNYYRIPVSRILPYNALLVPFTYFFYHHPEKPQSDMMKKRLDDFFWRVSFTERYSSSLEAKLAQDIKRIDDILEDRTPKYDYHADLSTDYIVENGTFSVGRSFTKAILCLYAYEEPKSFNDNSIVRMDNNWLKQVNSRNYHHFFPRAFLRKLGYEENTINHIANITIVDDYLNKRRIGAKPPSKYMQTFKQENAVLEETMKTHLIDDLEQFGIWEDDYKKFFYARIEQIKKALQQRIITTKKI